MPNRSCEYRNTDAEKPEQHAALRASDARQAAVVQAAYILESRTR
jgi:hypothetical protein